MKIQLRHTEYNGFIIEESLHMKSHSVLVYKNGDLVKCIAGDIFSDGTNNSIEKAKNWIDAN